MDNVEILRWAALLRDVGIVIGLPALIAVGAKLYQLQVRAAEARHQVLAETQYDKALSVIRAQKELFTLERDGLEQRIAHLQGSLVAKEGEIGSLSERLSDVNRSVQALDRSLEVISTGPVLSADFLIGRYRIEGINPIQADARETRKPTYEGQLDILATDVPTVVRLKWTIRILNGSQIFEGTGLLSRGVLAALSTVVGDEGRPTLVCYRLVSSHTIEGTWIRHGDTRIGYETCEKITSINRG